MKVVKRNGKLKILPDQLKKGIEVEQEHAKTVNNNAKIIEGIAMDHLKEDPKYYDKLEEIEDKKEEKEDAMEGEKEGK